METVKRKRSVKKEFTSGSGRRREGAIVKTGRTVYKRLPIRDLGVVGNKENTICSGHLPNIVFGQDKLGAGELIKKVKEGVEIRNVNKFCDLMNISMKPPKAVPYC